MVEPRGLPSQIGHAPEDFSAAAFVEIRGNKGRVALWFREGCSGRSPARQLRRIRGEASDNQRWSSAVAISMATFAIAVLAGLEVSAALIG